ncbi:DNA replication helicase dna2 isoform 2 [Hibiscus syriacus]|uniref:DNA replication ATP-dependent helicase/nuclease n=1 Tax=Hibiscus syriacus TaxID=106335 RepID=A0A6A2XTK3_HIBSY|nr:DNA replication helicase dna2 isoform 2 [Hibiscus syriacus]
MPPKTRRKPNPSSSKKPNVSNNQSKVQPSKFGIQHFFERHSQNALLVSQHKHTNNPSSPLAATSATPPKSNAAALLVEEAPANGVVSIPPNHNIHSDSSPGVGVADEVSPLITKSTSLKPFSFPPGMLACYLISSLCGKLFVTGMNLNSVEEIKLKFDLVKVVAVTCLGITSPLLSGKKFDVCIIDEAGQTTLPICVTGTLDVCIYICPSWRSLSVASLDSGMYIFIVSSRLSEAHPQAIAPLQSHYRMCQSIMELSNALIYGDRLRCGSPEIANVKLKFTKPISCSPWLKTAALEARDQRSDGSLYNCRGGLVNNGIEGKDIGIITPYNSRANLIRHACKASVETHTIDRYQGRDKDCILVSFVRSTENPRNCTTSLLADWHRINISLTRPKVLQVLQLFCCVKFLKSHLRVYEWMVVEYRKR